jgi:uncharacterized protein YndB with AHSA1/START domain
MKAPEGTQKEQYITMSHWVRAPRELVFRAFTELEHVRHWWGPFGFTNAIEEMRVAPGGVWRFEMRGPDGKVYPNLIRFETVVPPARLVFKHGTGSSGDYEFDVEILLTEERGGTRVVLQQTHSSAEQAKQIATYAIDGGQQTLTRLAGYLATMRETLPPNVAEGISPNSDAADFVINRVFDAKIELMYEVMTESKHLAQWFGPGGAGVRVARNELKPGGQFRYGMKMGPSEMCGRFVYREVSPPHRLAYVVSFTDPSFEPVRHPMSATWPLEVLAIATLSELNGKTLLMLRSIPIHAEPAERDTFRGGHSGMTQGFAGSYDQLDVYLRSLKTT